MKISKRTLRRMENLDGICDFDLEKKIATLHVHFSSAEEIVDSKRSTPEKPVLSDESIERMLENMDIIPVEFNVAFSVIVDDYQGYSPELLINTYKNGLENGYYKIDERKKSAKEFWLLSALVGILLIGVKVLGKKYEWFGSASAITTMLSVGFVEVFSEVFFEESIIYHFIHVNAMDMFKHKFRRLKYVECCDNHGNILCSLNQDALFEK